MSGENTEGGLSVKHNGAWRPNNGFNLLDPRIGYETVLSAFYTMSLNPQSKAFKTESVFLYLNFPCR